MDLVVIRQKMRKLWFSYDSKGESLEKCDMPLYIEGIDPSNFKPDLCIEEIHETYKHWDTGAPKYDILPR